MCSHGSQYVHVSIILAGESVSLLYCSRSGNNRGELLLITALLRIPPTSDVYAIRRIKSSRHYVQLDVWFRTCMTEVIRCHNTCFDPNKTTSEKCNAWHGDIEYMCWRLAGNLLIPFSTLDTRLKPDTHHYWYILTHH